MCQTTVRSTCLFASRLLLAALALLVFVALGLPAGAGGPAASGEFVPGEILIKVKPTSSAADIARLEQDVDADVDDQVAQVDGGTIRRIHSRSKGSEALIKVLLSNPNVVYAEPNYILHAD